MIDQSKRQRMGARNVLKYNGKQDPDYHYRWISDQKGRVDQAQRAGYEFVTDDAGVGDPQVGRPTKQGAKVTADSRGVKMYLMRIPKKWFEEDQSEKMAELDNHMEGITNVGSNEYIPRNYGGQSVVKTE